MAEDRKTRYLGVIQSPLYIIIIMTLTTKIIKIGDSKGIILYSNILKVLDWEIGDELEISIVGINQVILKKK